MKISKYNVFIPYNNALFIYNTLWNTVLVIKKDKVKDWGIGYIQKYEVPPIDVDTINILKEKRIIISDHIDEINLIQEKLSHTNLDESRYTMIIVPTLKCNFRCWYCYENHEQKKMMSAIDLEKIKSLVYKIIQTKNNLKTFDIQFFGGEPMIGYNKIVKPTLLFLKPILDAAKIKLTVAFTTNGYFFTKENLSFLRSYNLDNLQITFDGNKQRHNDVRFSYKGEDTFGIILNNVKMALALGIHVTVRLNISEETCLNVSDFLNNFESISSKDRQFLLFSIQKVWQASSTIENKIIYIVERIRKRGFECVSYYSSPSSIWNTCYSDKVNQITINPEGEIFKCTARDFDKGNEGILKANGEIEWKDMYYKRLKSTPLENSECRKCPILPICVGGCSQHRLENSDNNTCTMQRTQEDKIIYARNVLSEKLVIK